MLHLSPWKVKHFRELCGGDADDAPNVQLDAAGLKKLFSHGIRRFCSGSSNKAIGLQRLKKGLSIRFWLKCFVSSPVSLVFKTTPFYFLNHYLIGPQAGWLLWSASHLLGRFRGCWGRSHGWRSLFPRSWSWGGWPWGPSFRGCFGGWGTRIWILNPGPANWYVRRPGWWWCDRWPGIKGGRRRWTKPKLRRPVRFKGRMKQEMKPPNPERLMRKMLEQPRLNKGRPRKKTHPPLNQALSWPPRPPKIMAASHHRFPCHRPLFRRRFQKVRFQRRKSQKWRKGLRNWSALLVVYFQGFPSVSVWIEISNNHDMQSTVLSSTSFLRFHVWFRFHGTVKNMFSCVPNLLGTKVSASDEESLGWKVQDYLLCLSCFGRVGKMFCVFFVPICSPVVLPKNTSSCFSGTRYYCLQRGNDNVETQPLEDSTYDQIIRAKTLELGECDGDDVEADGAEGEGQACAPLLRGKSSCDVGGSSGKGGGSDDVEIPGDKRDARVEAKDKSLDKTSPDSELPEHPMVSREDQKKLKESNKDNKPGKKKGDAQETKPKPKNLRGRGGLKRPAASQGARSKRTEAIPNDSSDVEPDQTQHYSPESQDENSPLKPAALDQQFSEVDSNHLSQEPSPNPVPKPRPSVLHQPKLNKSRNRRLTRAIRPRARASERNASKLRNPQKRLPRPRPNNPSQPVQATQSRMNTWVKMMQRIEQLQKKTFAGRACPKKNEQAILRHNVMISTFNAKIGPLCVNTSALEVGCSN